MRPGKVISHGTKYSVISGNTSRSDTCISPKPKPVAVSQGLHPAMAPAVPMIIYIILGVPAGDEV